MPVTDRRRPHLRRWPLLVAALALALSGCGTPPTAASGAAAPADGATVRLHRTATCACCEEHRQHLEEAGFTTTEVVHDDSAELVALKERLGLPPQLRSCHTSEIAGYFVEGHAPAEVFQHLLDERPPSIDGLALPGMPAGSPGMPGPQTEPLVIYALSDGELSEFATVAP